MRQGLASDPRATTHAACTLGCVILEVLGEHGTAPYIIRWEDSDHETLFFPGPDAVVTHYARSEA
jgi:hypothetical protein